MKKYKDKKHTEKLNDNGGKTIIVNEFYIGVKTLKEKLLNIMIGEINNEKNDKKTLDAFK